jgi:hypothetical protein
VQISWAANHEAAVNRAGGGYRVYVGTSAGFPLSSVTPIDVPYASGQSAPTSTTIQRASGTYYIKVVGYSALGGGSVSAPSSEIQLVVP